MKVFASFGQPPLMVAFELFREALPRRPAPREQRVRLVNASGSTIGHTSASNAERMRTTLEAQHGLLSVLPA
jgi:hypothetical protein